MNNKVKSVNSDDSKLVYLQLLQEPIGRMSSASALFKGFSATILAGLATASFTEISSWALFLGLLPIIPFLCLDIYYLGIERKLKYRYKMVALDMAKIDFTINLSFNKKEKREARSNPLICLTSPSIWLFYVPVLGCAITLFLLKVNNIL